MKFAYLIASSAASGQAHRAHGIYENPHSHSEPVCRVGEFPLSNSDTPSASLLATGLDQQHTLGSSIARHHNDTTACHGARNHVWTHTSPCANDPSKGQEYYCVFGDPTFADGRGIALLTTPKRAAFLATRPVFGRTEAGLLQSRVRKYEVREVPGKGMGVVATEFIARGELVMVDRASVVIDYNAINALPAEQIEKLQAVAVDNLPAPRRTAILELSTQFQTKLSVASKIEQVMATNAFDVAPHAADAEQDQGFFVLFTDIARMNHDCRPNTDYYFDYDNFVQYVHAVRDIAPGEEITLSYINLLQERQDRHDRLHSLWGFQCSCSLCAAESAATEASDARVRQINELLKEFASYQPESRASTQLAEDVMRLYEQERLWSFMHEIYTYAAVEYNGVGDALSAIKYANLALEHGVIVVGPHNSDMQQMKTLASDPWSHWSWMLRTMTRAGLVVDFGKGSGANP